MGYRQKQTQAHCNRCGEPTLHIQAGYEVPHGGHLIVVLVLGALGMYLFWPLLLLAVLWIGIWFLHAFINWGNADSSYRCGRCGQRRGALTEDQVQQLHVEKARRQAARAQEREARRPDLEEIRRARARRRRDLYRTAWAGCCRVPEIVDDGLRTLAGDGNTVLHGFLRVLVIGLACINAVMLGVMVYRLL